MPTPEARRARLAHVYELLAGPDPIADLVAQLATMATEAMERQLWCGLTVLAEGQPVTLASSGEHAAELDRAQYLAEEGPCLDALTTGEPVEVNDQAGFARWPRWRPTVTENKVQTCLAVPMTLAGGPRGTLNLYSVSTTGFSAEERSAARDFAAHAAGAILVAARLAELQDLTSNLEAALTSRAVIDQAKGILMAQERCDADQAFAIMRTASMQRNTKVREIAAEIVDRVGNRSRPAGRPSPAAVSS